MKMKEPERPFVTALLLLLSAAFSAGAAEPPIEVPVVGTGAMPTVELPRSSVAGFDADWVAGRWVWDEERGYVWIAGYWCSPICRDGWTGIQPAACYPAFEPANPTIGIGFEWFDPAPAGRFDSRRNLDRRADFRVVGQTANLEPAHFLGAPIARTPSPSWPARHFAAFSSIGIHANAVARIALSKVGTAAAASGKTLAVIAVKSAGVAAQVALKSAVVAAHVAIHVLAKK